MNPIPTIVRNPTLLRRPGTSQRLTLAELADYFLQHWDLPAFVRSNYDDELEEGLGFFMAESDFYPEFEAMCRQRVIEHYRTTGADRLSQTHGG